MTMAPWFQKLTLTTHVTSSVGWFGAVAGFLALAVSGLASESTQTVQAAHLGMKLITWFVIVPLAFASFFTGIVQSLGTRWGLFKHYWILIKFVLTILATATLILHLQPIGYIAGAVSEATLFHAELRGVQIQLVAIAIGALVVLFVATTLSVYKPRGMTRYGQRKQREERGVA